MKVLIFSLGIKGFNVVKALFESKIPLSICCVIGEDSGVVDDFSLKLIAYCRRHGIKHCLRNNSEHDADEYDYFLAIGWRWIIGDIPPNKLIIFHDSLLPKYRGFAPLVNALLKRERVTGVTALLGADEYDKGNILFQKTMEISYPTTIEKEILRISFAYADLALELFARLSNNDFNRFGYPQDQKDATYSLWRDEDDYRIDWEGSANDITHFINCVSYPYRGASAVLNGSIVRIIKATARADVTIENRVPGKVIFMESNHPIVVCGSGLLAIEDIRSENGELMLPLKQFRSRFY